MKNIFILIVFCFPLFLIAGGDIGVGFLVPRAEIFSEDAGGISFYLDLDGRAKWKLNYRIGLDYTYIHHPSDGLFPGLKYTAYNYRIGFKWFPFKRDFQTTGYYLDAGPTITNSELETLEMVYADNSVTYVGSGSITDFWAKLYNSMDSQGAGIVPGYTTSSTDTGWNTSLGYEGNYWHLELMYERVKSELIDIGGRYIRWGFKW